MPEMVNPPPLPNRASPRAQVASPSASPPKTADDTTPVDGEPNIGVRAARMLIGPESMGFTFSVLLHMVVLLVMAVWFFDLEIPIEELLIDGSSKVGIEHDLLESPEISLTAESGQLKAERLVPPAELLAPPSPDFEIPASVEQALAKEAAEGAGNDDRQGDGSDDAGKATAPAGGAKRTANAVTKGSFTAWTVPEKPKPREPYYVIIEVRVPKKFGTRYKADDLSGSIRGNESKFGFKNDYLQVIPWDNTLRKLGGPTYSRHTFRIDARDKWIWLNPRGRYKIIPVIGGRAKIAIKVPGADVPRIKDTIKLQSKLLKEKQTLEIVF